MKKIYLFLLLLLLLPLPVLAAAGVEGRVAWRGQLIPGVRISAYRSLEQLVTGQAVAVSAPSELDGTYRLELPTGQYYLVARDFQGEAKPGNYFCYYSGSPVTVGQQGFRQVGFNLIKVPQEPAAKTAKRSGLQGRISYADEPLEQSYLYVYKDYKKNFKGPAYYIQPVAKGEFRLALPPGEYFILARKRARGGQYGPVEIDDYFNYYYGNPVRIEAGQVRQIELEAIQRLSMLEETPGNVQGVRGQIFGPDGKPRQGLRVFAYREPEMTGMPAFFSSVSDAQGNFTLSLPEFGSYYLLARQSFGGPAAAQELYGKYLGNPQHRIVLDADQPQLEVRIDVAPAH